MVIHLSGKSWKPSEDVERDKARVAEYEHIYPGFSFKTPQAVELRTGIIVAARFADKVRRAVFAAFGKIVPENVILRDVAEFNKKLYDELVSRGIGKIDLVRISVEVSYDPEKQKLVFGEPKIEKLYTEEEVKGLLEKLVEEKCGEALKKIEEIKKILG